ncbi:MAG: choice-of-anchor D domain-containing protein, partial [Actinocrinis sp.]
MNVVRGYRRAAIAALAVTGLISGSISVLTATAARADEVTASQDSYRTGWDPNESGLSPASVTSADFGQQFSTALDGQVYAQPLVVGNTLIAATENDKVYGLNASTGAILWTKDVGPFWPAATIGCSDLTPNLGITSTPVYDPSTGYVYLVAKANDGADAMHPHYYMHAVNPSTGAEKSGFPVAIGGHPSNDPTATFDPYSQGQRPGLLLVGGVVYAGFGSHCDYGTYHGYVAGVSTSGHQTALWSDETGAGNNGGGIWAGGGGLTSDGAGQIIVASGNGVSPAPGPGKTPPGNLAESVIRLSVNADGSLSPTDFFSPHDAPTMDANDTDFGAGGPMALPDTFGTAAHPHLLVQMGKDGRLFLLDRDNLGGRTSSTTGDPNALSMTGPYQGQWGHPAAWGGDGGYAYLVGNGGPLRAFKYGVTGSGVPALTLAGASVGTFPYTSGSPVVTSSGTTSGSAVVWTAWSSGPTGANAELRAYNAVPDASGNLTQLWSAPIGTAVKFTTPATNGGRVYVGTRDGKILAFGRPATSVLTGAPLSIGDVAVGATRSGTLAVTASSAISVTGVTSTSPFAATPPALPYPLAAGATLNLPVSFTPGAAGTQSGTVTVATDHGSVAFTVSGNGTKPGFGAVPPSATFADQPVGLSSTKNIQVTNTGTSPETISAVSTPSAPYTVSGLPAIGAAIPAGGS